MASVDLLLASSTGSLVPANVRSEKEKSLPKAVRHVLADDGPLAL